MARFPRIVLPGTPHHVTQRGNGRGQTFFEDGDYALYLDLLGEAAERARAEIWAYCLMPNHVHVIVTPTDEDGLRRTFADLHCAPSRGKHWAPGRFARMAGRYGAGDRSRLAASKTRTGATRVASVGFSTGPLTYIMVHPDMAFVRIDTWQPTVQDSISASGFALPSQLHHALWGTRIRRLLTLLITILVHIVAFWLAMNARGIVDPTTRKPGMTLINIGEGEARNDDQSEVDDSSVAPTERLPTDPAEWSVTRIKVAIPVSEVPSVLSAPASLMPSVSPSGASAARNASGGATVGGGIDPYAGSAPNWQQSAPAFRTVAQARPCFSFSPAGVEKQLAKMRSRLTLPPFLASMPMVVRLTLDAGGRVSAVEPPTMLADASSRDRIVRMFKGKKVLARITGDADPTCALVTF